MFSQIKRAAIVLSMTALGIMGCSQGETANSTPAAPEVVVINADAPQTPEAAVKAVHEGLKASKPVVIWDAMIPMTQTHYNQLVRDLAAVIDPEVWNRTVANLNKLVKLAETKKDFILASPLVQGSKQFSRDDLKASWTPALNLLKTIMQSELVDQEKMKKFDGHAFLEGTGAKLYVEARALTKTMKHDPLKDIDELKIKVVTLSNRSATATLQPTDPKAEPIELPLLVLEGRWTTDRFQLLHFLAGSKMDPIMKVFLPYRMLEWKDGYLADMARIEKVLDRLQAAKTSSDFQDVVSLQVLPFFVQKTVQFNQKPKPLSRLQEMSLVRPKATAMVIIKGEHFADEPAMLDLLKVFRGIEKTGNGVLTGPFPLEGDVLFLVSPVTDTTEFSKKIQVGKVTKVDVKRNMVSVDLPRAPAGDKTTADANGASKSAP